ncbi:hypothetical protein PISMIDRAFT_211244 [Pisolithus microcarpus 441]|uniref:Uncharacterized protein n=1 Tax=Pisolithus microcarpus 441 TaxID=765257 RepID=A0A0C9YV25_9AGAM|nr:hypothetical protein PISMIDRAFT_211244 [Pisolithus microcarpus 441]
MACEVQAICLCSLKPSSRTSRRRNRFNGSHLGSIRYTTWSQFGGSRRGFSTSTSGRVVSSSQII